MIAIVSPALNMAPVNAPGLGLTVPRFEADAHALAADLAAYAHWQLESALKVPPAIALRAFEYYQGFEAAAPAPTLLSFRGLAFSRMGAEAFTGEDWQWAQSRVAVLSALYGLLRPLDGLRPYRLDFMGRFRPGGRSLYGFWGGRVKSALFEGGRTVVNLCSEEYGRLVLPHLQPGDRLVTCRFLSPRRGRLVTVTTDAKAGRGAMVRFMVKNRLTDPGSLAAFDGAGFVYDRARSAPDTPVFVRQDISGQQI